MIRVIVENVVDPITINNKLEEVLTIENEVVAGIVKRDINKYGIVYTPVELVEKIIGLIPDRYFSDPELKWLDVGAGCGAFSCVVYSRLYVGLKGVISDSGERHNHIITTMLYMVENYPAHIVKLREIFGENANIIDKDFLSGKYLNMELVASRNPLKTSYGARPHARPHYHI